jgi:hypothetical protein
MASTDSPASINGEYDPTTDKARKAKSNDPGWKYGYWANMQDKNEVTCILCGIPQKGGIKRLKQHLAGGYADAKMCESSRLTTAIRKEMGDYLEKNKRKRTLFLDEEEEATKAVDVVDVENEASVIHHPSSGTAAKQRRSAYQFTSSLKPKEAPKAKKSVVEMLRRTPEEVVEERYSNNCQPTMEASLKTKEEKDYVDMQWALWFYECGIPFNAAAARQFQIAIEATAQYGSGYIPPTPYKLGEPLLKDAVKLTSDTREDHEKAWNHYGCTLMSDGWSDRRGRHLINFLVNSPQGTYFLESVDASSEVHNATMLADLLEEKIQEIGQDKVVQVVTDNGANYKAAGQLLMQRLPTLYWTPCAAYCLDLMLEEIGKLKPFKKTITRARRVTTFIYRHGRILSAMREKTNADLVRPAATRFATSFLTLKSLHKHKDPLKCLFQSDAWTGNRLSKTKAGETVHDTVLSTDFWGGVEDCLRASAPLLIVLRVVDGDEKSAMPEVAALMNHAKEKIKLSFDVQRKQPLLKQILKIIERRWDNQMDHPLYGAALFLNPGKFHPLVAKNDDATIGHLKGCFLDVLGRMVQDEETRNKIDAQAMDYEKLRGAAFSNKLAIQNLEKMNPSKCFV